METTTGAAERQQAYRLWQLDQRQRLAAAALAGDMVELVARLRAAGVLEEAVVVQRATL